MKTCSRCGNKKPLDQFHRDRNGPDGRRAACTDCISEANRLYRLQTYDQASKAAQARRYRERHPESIAKQRKKYRAENPEKDRANNIVNKAVARGALKRPADCSWCKVTGRVEGCHVDYAQPHKVVWLCPRCHRKLDAALAPLQDAVRRANAVAADACKRSGENLRRAEAAESTLARIKEPLTDEECARITSKAMWSPNIYDNMRAEHSEFLRLRGVGEEVKS